MSYSDEIQITVKSLKNSRTKKSFKFQVGAWICKFLTDDSRLPYKFCTGNLEERILRYLKNEGSIGITTLKYIVFPDDKLPKDSEFIQFIRDMEGRGLVSIYKNSIVSLPN